MAVNDGTYVIVSALNTDRALDCVGGSEANGANVRIYNRSDGDSQLVHVTTNSDGTRRIIFALSGKSVDVSGGSFADGKNVQQYADNSTGAQKWNFVDAGSTVTVDGTSYELYTIQNATNTGYVLDVSGGSAASGTNVQIYTDNSTAAQKWALVAQNPVPTGTYLIRSALDSKAVLDVSGGSTAKGANVQLYGANGTNAQVWRIEQYDASGLCVIYNSKSGLCLNVTGNSATDGANVQQYSNDGTTACKWLLEPQGTTTRNGVTVPLYRVHFMTGSGLVLDAAGGKSAPSTNIEIYTSNGTDAQKFDFEPFSMLADNLPVPASVMAGATSGEATGTSISANGITKIYPSWICDGTAYQCRYRIRTRAVGKAIGDWGGWMSAADGTAANDGWGDIGSANVTTANTARKYCTSAINITSVDNISVDYEEVQIEVRRFDVAYNGTSGLYAHGNSATQTIKLVWMPTLTLSDATWTANGLQIGYVSDYKRGGNTITINSIYNGTTKLSGSTVLTQQAYSGTIIIPVSSMLAIPEESTSIKVNTSLMTDAATATAVTALTVSYDASHGIVIAPSYTENRDYTVTVKVTSHASDSCYVWTGKAFYPCDLISSDGTYKYFRVVPPLNIKFQVCIMASDGANWGSRIDSISSMVCPWYVWSWGDECAVIGYGKEEPPQATYNVTPESEKQTTTGREYPVFGFTKSKEKDLSVSGVYVDELLDYSNETQFEKLEDAHHVIYRTPRGKWYTTAVTGVSFNHSYQFGGYGDVSIKQEAETL
jgi:hypothetical protein